MKKIILIFTLLSLTSCVREDEKISELITQLEYYKRMNDSLYLQLDSCSIKNNKRISELRNRLFFIEIELKDTYEIINNRKNK